MKTQFIITQHCPSGYDISIGVGKKFWAKDETELQCAIEHYFRPQTLKIHPKAFGSNVKECPLCRE